MTHSKDIEEELEKAFARFDMYKGKDYGSMTPYTISKVAIDLFKKDLVALISTAENKARIDELGNIQLEHGRYITQTFVDGKAMTIMERITELEEAGE